jgi:predicted enzyme related to lactoylglutathione lyase
VVRFDHLAIHVRDRAAARDWYVSVLGLAVEFEVDDAGVTAVHDDHDFTIFLEQRDSVAPECVLYFQVDDVDRRHTELTDRSVTFVHGPQVTTWGYGAELLDPDGHVVRLWDERSMAAHDDA